MGIRCIGIGLTLALGLSLSMASIFFDPRLYSGSECCACLQMKGPDGADVDDPAANCLPGDTESSETCSDEVASQMVEEANGDPIRVVAESCYTEACKDECQGAKDNDIEFTVDTGEEPAPNDGEV